jgi:hypothetical protein
LNKRQHHRRPSGAGGLGESLRVAEALKPFFLCTMPAPRKYGRGRKKGDRVAVGNKVDAKLSVAGFGIGKKQLKNLKKARRADDSINNWASPATLLPK